jgi:2-polyprenyl-6-methoxyphenol hydroxylase-like FAD-dependent oxidoreductase
LARKIAVAGGGPAGLYVATLIKRDDPQAQVTVTEQNPNGATFGFGVVFSDQALGFLETDDPQTHQLITPHMERWRNMTIAHQGEKITIDGIGFAAIGRLHLIQLLQQRALETGVEIQHSTTLSAGDVENLDADLIVGADGLNSVVRGNGNAYGTAIDHFSNHFAWFGTNKPFDTLTQTFVETGLGTMNAHHYRYSPGMSTFIVECDHETFTAHGFDRMDEKATSTLCEEIFAETLDGSPLIANHSHWRQFPRLWCNKWVNGNRVLIGDSAHTAHFSIGSGTRLGMEDAIALAAALRDNSEIEKALAAFENARKPVAQKIISAANTSALWYDDFRSKMNLAPVDFCFDYITRSGRVDLDRLRKLSPDFMHLYETSRSGDLEAAL